MTTRSTETRQFDVFLSHNSREKSAVETLAYKLRAEGLNPWLDKEQLIPGTKWQGGLADGLRASSTCAAFIGKDDLGNWESEEPDVAQNRAANDRDFRVIPVLLPIFGHGSLEENLPQHMKTQNKWNNAKQSSSEWWPGADCIGGEEKSPMFVKDRNFGEVYVTLTQGTRNSRNILM